MLKFKNTNVSYSIFALFISLLLLTNGISVYPLGEYSTNICEGIPKSTINLVEWMNKSLPKNALVLSDHRISNLLFAYGFNTSYDKNGNTWSPCNIWKEDDWKNCINELRAGEEEVSYIVIDDVMVKKGVVVDINQIYKISFEKFGNMPFKIIYRNCTYKGASFEKLNSTIDYIDYKNEEFMENVLHWAEIYEIDWEYIKNELH